MNATEAPSYRRCRKRHLVVDENAMPDGRCRRCKRRTDNRSKALQAGVPLCPQGHGLVPTGLTADGDCLECSTLPPAPAEDWLDWAAVVQVINGRQPVRRLTRYELLCAIVTVARRNDWTRAMAADWLRLNTVLEIPEDDGQYLELEWAPRKGLPVITANEAITRELRPDLLVADHAGELSEQGRPLHDDIVFGEGSEDDDWRDGFSVA
ncbi:hypothetical protein [Pseudonocardia sp. NPDC049154]|uniref:hypothetical protein n=1 Tax=Pseudonocardia sp. NPDC049154 TaxID=3155501 RepID=UPI0033FC9299